MKGQGIQIILEGEDTVDLFPNTVKVSNVLTLLSLTTKFVPSNRAKERQR
jgi:hypothetical protein